MENTIINCPHCGQEIPLQEAMSAAVQNELAQRSMQQEQDLKKQNEETLRLREEEFRAKLEEEKKAELAASLEESRKKQEEHDRLIREAQEREQQLRNEQEQRVKQLQLQAELAQEELEKAKLEAQEESIRKQREIEAKENQLRIDAEQQKLDLERANREQLQQLTAELRQQMETERLLKDAESNQLIASMTKQIEQLKTEAKSQQLQGEAQEVALEEVLRMAFPEDIVESVPKGFKGADCLLRIKTGPHIVGTIIFESKRTKQWSGEWIPKLKDDQRTGSAEIAVLVTQAFPAEVKNRTAYVDGVWLTDFSSAIGLVMALRAGLIEVSKMKNLSTNGDEKSQALFQYVCSPEFRQSIQAIAETFITFKDELAAEKRSMEKVWKRREKMLDRALIGTTRLHGGLQGILGASTMPDIEEPQKALAAGEAA